MLSIGAMGSGQANYYLGIAREDYYLQGGEPPGHWRGLGAKDLGLSGAVVNAASLNRLFEGFHPRDDRALIQNAGATDHQPGWDLTFSAPKSVSALWSQAGSGTRAIIQEAHDDAVKAALFYIESEAAITRRGKGGHAKEAAHLIVATFEHGTSRAQDPQLHTHCLVMNVCMRASDGTSGTIESKPLYQAKMTAGALYRAELAAQLEQRLDLIAERKGSCFEVVGVPQKIMTEFSKRRAEIETTLSEKGYSGAEASAIAALATRQVKGHTAREELFQNWQETGKSLGWGREEAATFLQAAKAPVRNVETENAEALSRITARITEQQSYFTERDFIRHLAEEAQGRGFGSSTVLATGIAHLAGSREIVALGRHKGEAVYSTREMMTLEAKLLDQVETSREKRSLGVSETTLTSVISLRQKLSEEQATALRHVCEGGPGNVRIVSGMAGTGKTTLLSAARLSWTLEGFEVHGAALSGKAAKGLEDGAVIKSETLHKTLWDIEKGTLRLHDKSVLVVDEAGMVGTRLMQRVVEKAQNVGARLVLVGDAKQLQPIEAGGPFAEMERRLGAATLTGIVRQREGWARGAVYDFAKGRAEQGLAAYAERGLLSIAPDKRGAYDTLISAWKVEGVRAPEEQLIFAGTRLDAAILNGKAQDERKKAGELGQESVSAATQQPEASGTFHVGDRVLFTKKSRLYGVENGSLGEVVAVDDNQGTLSARLDDGKRVSVALETFPHVRLGYAVTTHKGQGATVERAFVLAGGSMQDREITYVQVSRARGETQIFADRETAGEDLTRLVQQMSVSRQKEMAHTVAAKRPATEAPRPEASDHLPQLGRESMTHSH